MIDQCLERLAALDDILQLHSGDAIVVKSLDISPPLALGQIFGEVVKGGVQFLQVLDVHSIFQDRESV